MEKVTTKANPNMVIDRAKDFLFHQLDGSMLDNGKTISKMGGE